MSRRHRFDRLDVFAEIPYEGWPLAVVHDAQYLGEARMAGTVRWVANGPPGLREDAPDGARSGSR